MSIKIIKKILTIGGMETIMNNVQFKEVEK